MEYRNGNQIYAEIEGIYIESEYTLELIERKHQKILVVKSFFTHNDRNRLLLMLGEKRDVSIKEIGNFTGEIKTIKTRAVKKEIVELHVIIKLD